MDQRNTTADSATPIRREQEGYVSGLKDLVKGDVIVGFANFLGASLL